MGSAGDRRQRFFGTQRLHSIYCQMLNFVLLFCFRVICFCISMYQLRGIENFEEQKKHTGLLLLMFYEHSS